METLMSAEELLAVHDDPDLRLFDCRFSLQNPAAGLRAYQRGHIKGAMFADLEQDLSGAQIDGVTGRHPLPDKSAFIRRVLNWGLTPQTRVVVYDDSGGAGAARLWWLLLWIGHDRVAVLDGGLQAWLAAGGSLSTSSPKPWPRATDDYTRRPPLTRVVGANEINPDGQLLLDAREPPRFRGDVEPIDPVAGHIPGAQCMPFSGNLGADGLFLAREALRRRYSEVDATFLPVVCYCGSGVTACHNVLAIVHAGYAMPWLYAGSWSEWITDPNRPIARGD